MVKLIEESTAWAVFVVSSIITGATWIVRKVFTNEKEVQVLKTSMTEANKRIDEHYQASIKCNEDLKKSVDKLSEANIDILKHLRDSKND